MNKMFVAPDMYIVFELYLNIELLFIPVTRHHDASGHPARTGHAGLCVEAVGGGGAWPGHWPQGGWSTDLQLHQKDRNGKVSGNQKCFFLPIVITITFKVLHDNMLMFISKFSQIIASMNMYMYNIWSFFVI